MINRRKAEKCIEIYKLAMDFLLDDIDHTPEERLYARVAYLNLNALRNSLHRFLVVDKSAKSVTFHKVSTKRKQER